METINQISVKKKQGRNRNDNKILEKVNRENQNKIELNIITAVSSQTPIDIYIYILPYQQKEYKMSIHQDNINKSGHSEAKRLIENLHYYQLDQSSFVESKNQFSKYVKGGFPSVNSPTLEYQSKDLKHHKNNPYQPSNIITEEREDLTARNEQINLVKMQDQINQLKKQASLKDNMIMKINKINESLTLKTELLQQKLAKQMLLIEQKAKTHTHQHIRDISMNFHQQQPFCAQLLSPEQTVVVFKKLLGKISKSNLMTKTISTDSKSMETIRSFIKKVDKNY